MNTTATTGETPDVLRNAMVDRILSTRTLSASVERTMRQIERHRYVPQAPLPQAYDAEAVITHTFADGTSLSCASHPSIVATMLDMLDVQPGQRILEIGAGTGYNAALLATLTGPDGTVTTVDINSDVTTEARRHLDATGLHHVTVLTRDGAQGAPEHAPFDRVIITVGAWDIPSTWWEQLVPDGRLVVPLRWRGTTRAVALVKRADHWEAERMTLCGFVPMLGQDGEKRTTLDPGELVTIHYDIDQPVDPSALQGALGLDESVLWSEVTVHGEEPFDGVWLRLTATHAGTVRIQANRAAVDSGLCTPAVPVRSPALVDGNSLAYFTIRRSEQNPGRWQLGATGHGPSGRTLAEHIIDQIRAWGANRSAEPELTVFPAGIELPAGQKGMQIKKPGGRLVLRY